MLHLRVHVGVGLLIVAPLTMASCASSPSTGDAQGTSSSGGSSSSSTAGGSGGSGSSSGLGSSGGSSSGGVETGSGSGSGGTASGGSDTDSGLPAGSNKDSGGGEAGAEASAPPACVKGDTAANEVIMIGDSYMDIGSVGPDIMTDSMAMYRHYYLAGAAMNYGSAAFNIPYQYETQALMDTAVSMPKDIKVVIMDGGGNDVLIDNNECLTTAPLTSTCTTAIDGTLARAKKLLTEMAANGVKHIVYYFYPQLDPTGRPGVDVSLNYALPEAEALCCGSSFTTTATNYTCRGNAPGTDCIMIDTGPAFQGHNVETDTANYWFQSDNIHPNAMGGKVLSGVVWKAMQDNCIAQ
jgi:hypothetical protein